MRVMSSDERKVAEAVAEFFATHDHQVTVEDLGQFEFRGQVSNGWTHCSVVAVDAHGGDEYEVEIVARRRSR